MAQSKAVEIAETNLKAPNREYLFHGTSKKALKKIIRENYNTPVIWGSLGGSISNCFCIRRGQVGKKKQMLLNEMLSLPKDNNTREKYGVCKTKWSCYHATLYISTKVEIFI